MKPLACLSLLVFAAMPAASLAQCPPMSAYQVAGVYADDLPITDAMRLLFAGTDWKPHFQGQASDIRVTLRGLSGPLDVVFEKVIAETGRASTAAIAAISNPALCVATVSVKTPPALAAPVPAILIAADKTGQGVPKAVPTNVMPEREILPAGNKLSTALRDYIERHGWQLHWRTDKDYKLAAPLAIPPMDIIDGVMWVVHTYQARGEMQGVAPRFDTCSNVVVIEPVDVSD